MIFGVSNAGVVVGLEDAEGDSAKISEFIKTRIRPIPPFKLRFEVVDEKKMVILKKRTGNKRGITNYAVRMYEKVGFKTVGENEEEYIMVCEL